MLAAVPFLTSSIAALESAKLQLEVVNPLITKVATEVNDISELVKPPLKKVGEAVSEARETVDSLYGPLTLKEENNALNNQIDDVVETKIIDNIKRDVENAKNPEDIEKVVENGKLEIQKLQEMQNQRGGQRMQTGGKKILARTNKSIAQFLNSKVTFQSILKRMTSKYKRVNGVKKKTKRQYKR